MDSKRKTIQRQAILESVRELGNHPTAEQVYGNVVKKHPSISKATVYRNLGQMAEAGELLNIGSFLGSVRYDHNCHRHYHFICGGCGKTFDANGEIPGIMDNDLTGLDGFEVTGYSLSFSGLCRECKENNRQEGN